MHNKYFKYRYIVFPVVILPLVLLTRHYLLGTQAHQNPPVTRIGEIAVPEGCTRITVPADSFGAWLRELPLKPPDARIRLYNGRPKTLQHALHQVIDLPIGDEDLQQCADAAIRLRSDYLFNVKKFDKIAFNFTSGDCCRYAEWIKGYRPLVKNDKVTWEKRNDIDSSYAAYQSYLKTVFMYAGSYSLSRQLDKVNDIKKIKAGDCFIQGGFPGHVIIVVDIAVDTLTGDKLVLLAQGYTPAQDIHVIKNPEDNNLSPWFRAGEGRKLETVEWDFKWSELYKFD